MKPEITPITSPLPADWLDLLSSIPSIALDPRALIAWVELDLDDDLRFKKSLLLLTKQSLIWTNGTLHETWPIQVEAHLSHGDHAGVGHLKLELANKLLRIWYFTLAVNPQILRLQSAYRQLAAGSQPNQGAPEANEYDKQVCPVCLNAKPANSDACSTCEPEDDKPPSTWTLFKLWRFARPYKKQLLLGFILTLLTTRDTLKTILTPRRWHLHTNKVKHLRKRESNHGKINTLTSNC